MICYMRHITHDILHITTRNTRHVTLTVDTLHMKCYTWHVTHDTLHMTRYTWHITHDTLHMTRYTWHVTHDTLHMTCYTYAKLRTTRYTRHVTNDTLHMSERKRDWKWMPSTGLPTPKFCSEPYISLQGTSWEPKSNMQNHFRTNEKKSILTRKNTFYLTLSARGLYNYSELFPSPGISVSIRF